MTLRLSDDTPPPLESWPLPELDRLTADTCLGDITVVILRPVIRAGGYAERGQLEVFRHFFYAVRVLDLDVVIGPISTARISPAEPGSEPVVPDRCQSADAVDGVVRAGGTTGVSLDTRA